MSKTYATQYEAARRGYITEEMALVASEEKRSERWIQERVASGQIVIPANRKHNCLKAKGIGRELKTKVNVNIGVSQDVHSREQEWKKVEQIIDLGADALMDLSCHGDTSAFRRALVRRSPIMIGTVPVYDSVIRHQKDLAELTAEDFLEVIAAHAQDGVDFVTIHAGIKRDTLERIRDGQRVMNIVSRGGAMIFAWMSLTGKENPFFTHFDQIIDICRQYDVTLSLGDACRPGCLADATDALQTRELIALADLMRQAHKKDVQVMIEGPGHMSMDQIAANMILQRRICEDAPFYVLGPLVTDIAPGYDHITGAIGGAIAAASGAAFLCDVTPAEHLALPNEEDIRQGLMASKIAAHAADIAKGLPQADDMDLRMARARQRLDWEEQFCYALDPERAKQIRNARQPEVQETCSMCGKFCAVRNVNKAIEGKEIKII